jgi:hypothetical protein
MARTEEAEETPRAARAAAAGEAPATSVPEGEDRPPGKPVSQVEAEAPPDAETAAALEAELASREPGAAP